MMMLDEVLKIQSNRYTKNSLTLNFSFSYNFLVSLSECVRWPKNKIDRRQIRMAGEMTQEMQQSMELSHEIVIANGHLFGIQGFTCNITLSLEQIGRTYNGVSMALPFVLLIISAIKKNSLRKDYVATGDVSLAGAVLTV